MSLHISTEGSEPNPFVIDKGGSWNHQNKDYLSFAFRGYRNKRASQVRRDTGFRIIRKEQEIK